MNVLTTVTVLAELGDLSRFDNPRELMSHVGLVTSEDSSGARRYQGGITETGNGHVRRVLVEAAWSYRFAVRKTAHLQLKAASASPRGAGSGVSRTEAPVRPLSAALERRQAGLQGDHPRGP